MIKLFTAESIVNEYSGYKNVKFNWFVVERYQPQAPYSELIKDYIPSEEHQYSKDAIKEFFTEEEVILFEKYLYRKHADDQKKLEIEEVDLPIPNNMLPFGAIGEGSLDGYYDLYGEVGYNLPFAVSAYYDLEGNEDFRQKVKAEERKEKKRIEGIPINELRSLAINDTILRSRLLEILEEKE
jgi:hypothetical protein